MTMDFDPVRWFERRTYFGDADLDRLVARKRGPRSSVSICLPALDEAATVGAICAAIRTELMEKSDLVDELVVVDSGSSDGTHEAARSSGATVVVAEEIVAGLGAPEGKGDVLWRSLAILRGDIIVWLDADTRNFHTRFITNLIAPLLEDDELLFVKGFYRRPRSKRAPAESDGGGRVTEIAARPLLNLLFPRLAGFVQPLSGEYAGRRAPLLEVPFAAGYGVDVGLLIDLTEQHGLEALGQADLGERVHRSRDLRALGSTGFQVAHAILSRADEAGIAKLADDLPAELLQFDAELHHVANERPPVKQRPPMADFLRRRGGLAEEIG